MNKSICCSSKVIKHPHLGNCCAWCLQKCDVQKTPHNKWILIVMCVLALFTYSIDAKAPFKKQVIRYYQIIKPSILESQDVKLNDSSILQELIKNDCVLPNIAIAQARIETANYTSNICLQNKNIFGIKHNRHGFSQGMRNEHAYYDSYKDCIKDYCRIQQMYLKKIDGKYAEASNYITTIQNLK